jgi:hypothetical protein
MANEGKILGVVFDPTTRKGTIEFQMPERGTYRPDVGGGLDASGKEASKRETFLHGSVTLPPGVVLSDGAKMEVNVYAPTPYGLGVKAARRGGSTSAKPLFTMKAPEAAQG